MNFRSVLVLLGLMLAGGTAQAAGPMSRLHVEGTAFVLQQTDGRVRRGADLVGAELDLGNGVALRIDAVHPDAADAEILLHKFSQRTGGGDWQPVCEAGQEGFPIGGRWVDGQFQSDNTHFLLTCTNGAQAKCARWGYKPWKTAPDGSTSIPMYQACIHMARADYCGDDHPTTRNGTTIDVFDHHGVQQSANGPDFHFEAGWSPAGAVCVNHTRIPQNMDLATLAQHCPKLRDALGEQCDEATAQRLGAVVFNRSR